MPMPPARVLPASRSRRQREMPGRLRGICRPSSVLCCSCPCKSVTMSVPPRYPSFGRCSDEADKGEHCVRVDKAFPDR